MGIRIAVLAVLTLAGAAFGRAAAEKRLKRADALLTLSQDIKLLRELTLSRLNPLGDALAAMKTPALCGAGRLMKENSALSPGEALKKAGGVLREEAGALGTLFANLSALSKKEHAEEYEKCLSAIQELENTQRRLFNEKRKLYVSLGALTALGAGILMV